METLYQILAIVGAGLILWFMYFQVKNRPEMFRRENINKSFSTLGVLGLVLIVFVAVLIWIAKM